MKKPKEIELNPLFDKIINETPILSKRYVSKSMELRELRQTVMMLKTCYEEAEKRNFQLLQDNVKLEGEIINLKSRLSKYENINSQLKK